MGNRLYSSGVGDTDARLFLYVDGSIRICNGRIVTLLIPATSMNMQVLVFSVLSVVAIIVWKFYGKKHPMKSDQPLLNKRGVQYIGRVFNLYEPIKNGQGKIKVDDSIWKVHGEDCDINSQG